MKLEMADLVETRLLAISAKQAGFPRVALDPSHAIELVDIAMRLANARSHKCFDVFLCTLAVDREEWLLAKENFGEEYEGEAADRLAMFDQVWLLLTGKPYESPSEAAASAAMAQRHLRLVKESNDEPA